MRRGVRKTPKHLSLLARASRVAFSGSYTDQVYGLEVYIVLVHSLEAAAPHTSSYVMLSRFVCYNEFPMAQYMVSRS